VAGRPDLAQAQLALNRSRAPVAARRLRAAGEHVTTTRRGWHGSAWLAWQRVTSWAARKGTLIVAAAGNESTNSNGTLASSPADLPSVMSVSSTGTNQWVGEPAFDVDADGNLLLSEFTAAPGSDVLAFYSNTGAAVDIAAPGGDCGPAMDCWSMQAQPHQILSVCAVPAWVWVGPEEWDRQRRSRDALTGTQTRARERESHGVPNFVTPQRRRRTQS
jgi:hypothetical protein